MSLEPSFPGIILGAKAGGASGAAGGDLAGTYPNPTISNAAKASMSDGMPMSSGLYYLPIQGTALATGAMSANNREICWPFLIAAAATLNEIKTNITTIGDVGSKIRLGIRADAAGGLPGAVLVDAGQVAGDAVASPAISISLAVVPGVWYWLSMTAQAAATTRPTVLVFTQGWHCRIGTAAISASGACSYYQDGVSGALGSFTKVGTLIPSASPVSWLKAA